MNQLKVYPLSVDSDFPPDVIKRARELINSSSESLKKDLPRIFNEKEFDLLLCASRLLLEQPINTTNASLFGWFVLNQIIPTPTQYVLMNIIIAQADTDEGFKAAVMFAKALLPRIHKYPTFCKKLTDISKLHFYDRELYLLLFQVAYGEPISSGSYSNQYHYVPPETSFSVIPTHSIRVPAPLLTDFQIKPKQNIFASLDYAATLSGEQQRMFLIQVCLKFKPPLTVNIDFPPLLSAACDYTLTLLDSLKGQGWNSFDAYPWLDHMGSWINTLSIANGRPPPLHMIDIPGMLKDAARSGIFGPAMAFMMAFFRRALSVYSPPCPYTTACLEIMAAVLNEPGIRTDVITLIKNFGLMFSVDVNSYFRRRIDIPADSFDKHAVFVKNESGIVFKKAEKNEDASNTIEDLAQYFSYRPKVEELSGNISTLAKRANEIEKYYFVGKPTDVIPINGNDENSLSLLQSIVSLAMSDTTVLSQTAMTLLKKMSENIESLDLSGIFRLSFPRPFFFSLVVEKGFYNIETLANLFCDLLTNPKTEEISKPYIYNYVSLLPQSPELRIVYSLLNTSEKAPEEKLPQPDKTYVSLIQSFYYLCKNPTDSARLQFVNQLSPASSLHMKAMLLAILNASQKLKKMDYSIVDFLTSVLSRCTLKISPDTIISNTQKAIELLPKSVFKSKRNSKVIFRFFYTYLNGATVRQKEKLLSLCEFLSPRNFPNFACCWIQLCMHKQCFQQFAKKNEPKFSGFCISFVRSIIDLAIRMPAGLYKQVATVLMVIASDCPSFFAQYYELFIGNIPLRYIQYRNIILCSQPREFSSDKTPHISFEYVDALEEKALVHNIKPFLKTEKNAHTALTSNIQYIASTLKREATESNGRTCLFWQFVLYCIVKAEIIIPTESIGCGDFSSLPIVSLFKQLAMIFGAEAGKLFVNGIIDQIRFPSSHTTIASEMLFTIFDESPNYVRELVFTELARRLVCVTQPPRAVKALYIRIVTKHKQSLTKMFTESGQIDVFKNIINAIQI